MLKFLLGAAFALVVFAVQANAAPATFHIVLEINFKTFWHDQLDVHFGDFKRRLDKAGTAYADLQNADGRISVHIADAAQRKEAVAAMTTELAQYEGHVLVTSEGSDKVTIALEPGYRRETEQKLLDQSLGVIRFRLKALLQAPGTVRAVGDNRIIIELASLADAPQATALFAAPPLLTVHLVDDDISGPALARGVAPPGDIILPSETRLGAAPQKLAVRIETLLSGDRIRWAQSQIDERSGEPVVSLHLDEEGTAIFAEVTRANLRQRLAIVIDGRVLSAPVIVEPIVGGNVQISGVFTTAQAQDLAARLTRGSIPAPIRIIESSAGPLPQ